MAKEHSGCPNVADLLDPNPLWRVLAAVYFVALVSLRNNPQAGPAVSPGLYWSAMGMFYILGALLFWR
jgi:hypothetical protein